MAGNGYEGREWDGFRGTGWKETVDVRRFIQENYKPYEGDESFLEGATEATNRLWGRLQELQKEERAKGGVLDMETQVVSGITAYPAAYILPEEKELEKVVGLQPLPFPLPIEYPCAPVSWITTKKKKRA